VCAALHVDHRGDGDAVAQERPGSTRPSRAGLGAISKFKTVSFTRSQVGGLHLTQVNATANALDQDGPVQIAPGKLTTGYPSAFTITEKSDK
jgi:hypothetical protein